MKQTRTMFFVFSIIFFLALPAYCADVAKIGIIDFQRILTESSAGKQAKKRISEKGDELKSKLEAMQQEVKEMNLNLEREALVMSKDKRTEKQREIRIKINDFKQKQVEFEKEFKALEGEIIRSIQNEVHSIAQDVGKNQGYLMILMKEAAGVIYSPDEINITDLVIKKYNQKLAQSQ